VSKPEPGAKPRSTLLSKWIFALGLVLLAYLLILLRFSIVTDYFYHATVKDPERVAPSGPVIVAPADGTILYVKRIEDGVAPEIVKRGVPVPLAQHLKTEEQRVFPPGYLIGVYMSSDSVHVNRAPIAGEVRERILFNGPHMDMSPAERTIILTQLIPGWVELKKWFGLAPYAIEDSADFVTKSARETLVIRDLRLTDVYVSRIADYSVGRILTWVEEGERVETGQRLGMITWGSQTDLFFAETPGMEIKVEVGDFVYAGETVLARF